MTTTEGSGGRGGAVQFLRYTPPGPVAKRWIEAMPRGAGGGAGAKFLIGPVGSGKTRGAYAYHLAVASDRRFRPSPFDGMRHYKFVVIRPTYRQLWDASIPSWWKQVPRDATGTEWVGGADGPATHTCAFVAPDGVPVVMIAEFLAWGDRNPVEVLAGTEFTSVHFEEVDLMPSEGLHEALKRCGRYPDKDTHGEPWWYGITGVCNAFEIFHPLYKVMQDPPQGWVFMRQPSGLSPHAENIQNLPRGYYQAQAAAYEKLGRKDLIRKDILNEHGIDRRAGKPVFEEAFFSDQHVSRSLLDVDPRRPVLVGGDGGRHPAVVFCQQNDRGQWRVLGMLYCEGIGAPRFAEEVNRYIAKRFGPLRLTFEGYGDPTSANLTESSERSWMQIMNAETRIRWRPAPGGNDIELRLSAVFDALAADVGYGERGLLLDPSCDMLIQGFAGGYQYRQVRGEAGDRYEDKPNKNKFSNPMDALQNALLGGGAYYTTRVRDMDRRRAMADMTQRPRQAITDQTPGFSINRPRSAQTEY